MAALMFGSWTRKAKNAGPPADATCALIGPPGAGKTLLLASLRHRPDVSHSLLERYAVEVAPSHAAGARGFEALGDQLDQALRNGLLTPTSRGATTTRFELSTRALARGAVSRDVAIDAIDVDGATLLSDDQSSDEAFRLVAAADTAILCLEIDHAPEQASARRRLVDRLRWLRTAGDSAVRRLIVTLTCFERPLIGYGRDAYRLAATPETALPLVQASLLGPWEWLVPSIDAFAATRGRQAFVQPASSFGFTPMHGGANLDPSTGLLRTRAHSPDEAASTERPYAPAEVERRDWRPFLTTDPFLLIATGEPGALTFSWPEALGE